MANEQTLMRSVIERSIAGAGLVALDIILSDSQAPSLQLRSGGTCGNVLTILSFLTWSATPVACLSNDFAGVHVRRDLQRWGVNTTLIGLGPMKPTPIYVERLASRAGGQTVHTFFRRCPSCRALLAGYSPITRRASNVALGLLGAPAACFFDRVSSGILLLAQAFSKIGTLVIFEPSFVGNPTHFKRAVEIADILVCSAERIRSSDVTRRTSCNRPRLDIITQGRSGLSYRSTFETSNTSGWEHLKAFEISEVRDTAGAGDWFTAGLIHKLGCRGVAGLSTASRDDVRTAITYGQALGAWTCRFEGARGGMYTFELSRFERDVAELLSGQQLPKGSLAHDDWSIDDVHAGTCSEAMPATHLLSPVLL